MLQPLQLEFDGVVIKHTIRYRPNSESGRRSLRRSHGLLRARAISRSQYSCIVMGHAHAHMHIAHANYTAFHFCLDGGDINASTSVPAQS